VICRRRRGCCVVYELPQPRSKRRITITLFQGYRVNWLLQPTDEGRLLIEFIFGKGSNAWMQFRYDALWTAVQESKAIPITGSGGP
jgi:hypothetical protein